MSFLNNLFLVFILALGASCSKRKIDRNFLNKSGNGDTTITDENTENEQETPEGTVEILFTSEYLEELLAAQFSEFALENLRNEIRKKSVGSLEAHLNTNLTEDDTPLVLSDLSDEEYDKLLETVTNRNLNKYMSKLALDIIETLSDLFVTLEISISTENKVIIKSFQLRDQELHQDLQDSPLNADHMTNNDKAFVLSRLAFNEMIYPRIKIEVPEIETKDLSPEVQQKEKLKTVTMSEKEVESLQEKIEMLPGKSFAELQIEIPERNEVEEIFAKLRENNNKSLSQENDKEGTQVNDEGFPGTNFLPNSQPKVY